MVVLAVAAVAGASATAAWLMDRRRSQRRNAQGTCASCGAAWDQTPSAAPHLMHGRLVCDGCAERTKRRLVWQFGTLAGAAGLATVLILASKGLVLLALFPATSTVLMTFGTTRHMKRANREAQWRIAAGHSPDFAAINTRRRVVELTGGSAVSSA